MSNHLQLLDILAELQARNDTQEVVPALVKSLFPKQRAVLDSTARRTAVLCSRRAGKSYCLAVLLLVEALSKHNSISLYLALTRRSAKRIMFPLLRELIAKYHIQAEFQNTDLIVYFPATGSTIELAGADTNEDRAERFLGSRYTIACIDEAGSFDPELLAYLVETILSPALIDTQGRLLLVGTPREIHAGPFYEATTNPTNAGYSFFSWNTTDNPHLKHAWIKELDTIEQQNPTFKETATYKREYLGQWTLIEGELVYSGFNTAINTTNNAIDLLNKNGVYITALDPGFTDSCAVVQMFGCKGKIYALDTYKAKSKNTAEIAAVLREYQQTYSGTQFICDSAARTMIEDLRVLYAIPIKGSEKTRKNEAISQLNSDFERGNIQIYRPNCQPLVTELTTLPWRVLASGERIEHPSFDNHLTDALLYGYRSLKTIPLFRAPVEFSYEEQVKKQALEKAKQAFDQKQRLRR